MNTRNALRRIIYELDSNLPDGITKDNLFDAIDVIKASLVRGGKYEELCNVLVEKYDYAYVHKLVDKSAEEVSQVREIMAKLRAEFFGTSSKSKHQRLNEVIDRLGVYMQVGKMSGIIELLVELRDEEEDV